MELESPMKVVWSEGMPLWPQHLQQLDRYYEQCLARRLRVLNRWDYGVVHCEFDLDALSAGLVAVKRFVGVLPDGALVSFGSGQAHCPKSRPLDEHYRPEIGRVDVYVAIAREREGVANYTRGGTETDANRVPARFHIESRTLPDLVGSGEAAVVDVARPNVMLRLGSESRDDFDCLKIAEITRDGSGRYTLVRDFIPAAVHTGSSAHLLNELRALHSALVERDRLLSASSQPWGTPAAGMDAANLLRLAINPYVVWLQHVCEAGDLSPRGVHLELLKLVGQLAMFRNAERASLPAYDHNNLRGTFAPLFSALLDMLQVTLRTQRHSVSLHVTDGGLHSGALDASLSGCNRFFLGVCSALTDVEVGERLPLLAKAASQGDLASLLSSATPGVRLRFAPSPPPEVATLDGEICFAIDTAGEYWSRVIDARDIAVYLPQPFDPKTTRLRLIGLPHAGGKP